MLVTKQPRYHMNNQKRARTFLIQVHNFIEKNGTCRGALAIARDGHVVGPLSKEAVAWNLEGACLRSYPRPKNPKYKALARRIAIQALEHVIRENTEWTNLTDFNDNNCDIVVINMVRKAIEYLKEREAFFAQQIIELRYHKSLKHLEKLNKKAGIKQKSPEDNQENSKKLPPMEELGY